MLRPDRLTAIRSVDPAAGTVTVEAGCPLHVLNAELLARGLSLANMGDIQVQTVAGATQTGTHGTGRDVGGMAAQVAGLELALADGSIVTCSADSPSGGLTFPDGTAHKPVRRRPGRPRRTRHRHRGYLPRRSGLPAGGPRGADDLVCGDEPSGRAHRGQRAFRVLLVPAQRGLPDQAQQPDRRPGHARSPAGATCWTTSSCRTRFSA